MNYSVIAAALFGAIVGFAVAQAWFRYQLQQLCRPQGGKGGDARVKGENSAAIGGKGGDYIEPEA